MHSSLVTSNILLGLGCNTFCKALRSWQLLRITGYLFCTRVFATKISTNALHTMHIIPENLKEFERKPSELRAFVPELLKRVDYETLSF